MSGKTLLLLLLALRHMHAFRKSNYKTHQFHRKIKYIFLRPHQYFPLYTIARINSHNYNILFSFVSFVLFIPPIVSDIFRLIKKIKKKYSSQFGIDYKACHMYSVYIIIYSELQYINCEHRKKSSQFILHIYNT